jgi:hypothetical protein
MNTHYMNLVYRQRSCCEKSQKSKVVNNSNPDVYPYHTQVERAVNTILFVPGGRTQYGNRFTLRRSAIDFLGKTEGQPGGILGPIKNKF